MMCPLSKETIIFRDKGCQLILSFVANCTKQAIWFYIPNSMYQGVLQALDAVAKLQKWKILAFGGSWLCQEIHRMFLFFFFFFFLSFIVITSSEIQILDVFIGNTNKCPLVNYKTLDNMHFLC